MMKNKVETEEVQLQEQKIFSGMYVDRMFLELIDSEDIGKYEQDNFPYDENYPAGGTKIFLTSTAEIILPEGQDNKDLENTKIIYSAYKDLTPTQASDPRLWTYLSHVTYWHYMKLRWPVTGTQKPINRIRDRYFLRRLNLEALSRNGISRLWWYGHLTFDESRTNPWELTEVLLSRADLAVGITERGLGSNANIRVGILEYLLENEEIRKNEAKTRELMVKLNLVGGVKNLPFLDSGEIKDLLYSL